MILFSTGLDLLSVVHRGWALLGIATGVLVGYLDWSPPELALLGMTDPLLAEVLGVSLERLPYPGLVRLQEPRYN